MRANHSLPDEPVRSKGEATLLPDGCPLLPVTIHDISASRIGVIAASVVHTGTSVEVHIHHHEARGTVEICRPEGGAFYIAIALAA